MKTTDLVSMASAIILPCGDIMRTLTDGVYKIIEMWTSGGNKILRMELKGMRLHGRCTEWNKETGEIISDNYFNNGYMIDIHCNKIV